MRMNGLKGLAWACVVGIPLTTWAQESVVEPWAEPLPLPGAEATMAQMDGGMRDMSPTMGIPGQPPAGWPGPQAIQNYYRVANGPNPPGPERLHMPTPAQGYGFHGVPNANMNTRQWPNAKDLRLDTTYKLFREWEAFSSFSEYQTTVATGATILPFQSPCFLVGLRGLAVYRDNMSVWHDTAGGSIDVFMGTRYKSGLYKLGYFFDGQDELMKMGLTTSILLKVPVFNNLTYDMALGYRIGDDQFVPTDLIVPPFQRRIEPARLDYQFRLGSFIRPNVQVGFTANYYAFDYVWNESGYGAFANIYHNRFRFGFDVTGGDEGLRGFVNIGIDLGPCIAERQQSCNWDIDIVRWVTLPTIRDVSIRMRESLTGPPNP